MNRIINCITINQTASFFHRKSGAAQKRSRRCGTEAQPRKIVINRVRDWRCMARVHAGVKTPWYRGGSTLAGQGPWWVVYAWSWAVHPSLAVALLKHLTPRLLVQPLEHRHLLFYTLLYSLRRIP
jgi:hypothetical protein